MVTSALFDLTQKGKVWLMNEPWVSNNGNSESTYLVTSAIEATWPVNEPVVFLGQWCLRYSRREVWSALDYSVAPYRWDDGTQIPKDLEYINGVYETLLPELASVLNDIHGVDYSVRYWRIVVGWWLFCFVQIFFDRWQAMRAAIEAYPHARMLRMPSFPAIPASRDMTEFLQAISGEVWNERLCADIAESWTNIRVYLAADITTMHAEQKIEPEGQESSSSTRRKIYKHVTRVMDWFSRRRVFYGDGVALHSDYLRRLEKVKIALMLRQIPSMSLQSRLPLTEVVPSKREWTLGVTSLDAFVNALAEMIPLYIPTCYLEGYAKSAHLAKSSGSMRSPKVIMTSNAFSSDDRWKLWAGLEVEKGAKLVIGQHGGHYGAGAWSATQMHEIAISDRYLSWGWSDSRQSKVHPAPATKLIGMKKRALTSQGKCLQVTSSLPSRSYWLFSGPVGPQFESYLDDQLKFAAALSSQVRSDLIVRSYSQDYGWDIEERWGDTDPSIEIDPGLRPIEQLLAKTKLYVATYNATTFLESFTQGIPTVIFWNPNFWELSEGALPYFEVLRKASVLFDDPVSCAEHVNSIWDDVPAWWGSPKVQCAVKEFTQQYAYVGPRPLRELKNALTQWQ